MSSAILAAFLLTASTAFADPTLTYPQSCSLPQNADRWGIRPPNDDEVFEFGRSVLIFEYWNSTARCSSTIEMGIYFGELRFIMAVQVSASFDDPREVITITVPPETPYYAEPAELLLDDGEEPGRIILYPLLG
jgi:hypothetical protein